MTASKKNILNNPPLFYVLFYDPYRDEIIMTWKDEHGFRYSTDLVHVPNGVPTSRSPSDWVTTENIFSYREIIEQC